MEYGIFHDIPPGEYYSNQAVSNSYLQRLHHCPLAAGLELSQTPTLKFGRALHCFVLEGEEIFKEQIAVAPEVSKRTEIWKLFETAAEMQAKTIITQKEADKIKAMDNAVRSHPLAGEMLLEGKPETTVFWNDPTTGLDCKCRIDWIPGKFEGVLVDLKTTQDASPKGFERSIAKYGYARQAAIYLHGINQFQPTKKTFDIFVFIAIETTPPYRTEVYTLSEEWLQWGYRQFRELIEKELVCRGRKFYPNFTHSGAIELDKPRWV